MNKRPITPTYIFFYILFWPDSWRIVMGLITAFILTPYIVGTEGGLAETSMLSVMLAAIGYAVSAKPARWFSGKLRQLILKGRI